MLTIRLKREGKKHQATMRIVVVDSKKSAVSNRYVEKIGWWIPSQHKSQINKERALYWISKGAKPSATVHNLFINENVIEGAKIPKHKLHAFKPEAEVKEQPAEIAKPEIKVEEAPAKEDVKEEIKEEQPEVKTEEIPIEEAPVETKKDAAEDSTEDKKENTSEEEKTN